MLENLDSVKYPLPEPFPYDTAQQLFAGEQRIALGQTLPILGILEVALLNSTMLKAARELQFCSPAIKLQVLL